MGQNDYGVLTKKSWWKVYSLTLPLNLTKCLLKLKEHWNIIAPHQLLKSPQNQLDFLIGFFKELQQMCKYQNDDLHALMVFVVDILNYLCMEVIFQFNDVLFNST